jgi:nucleotide-binding universal stress UspA family protein
VEAEPIQAPGNPASKRFLTGSVSDRVVEHACCDVFAVR